MATDGTSPRESAIRRTLRDLNPRAIGGPKLPLLLIGLSSLIAQWDDAAIGILGPEIRGEFALSTQLLLTLVAVLNIVSTLIGPALGYLADRVSRVWMLRVGALLANLGSILAGAAGGVPQLVASRTVSGLGAKIYEPAGFPVITDYYRSTVRARVFAFIFLLGGIGAILGPVIAGSLGEAFGWRAAVISLGALATLVSLGYFALREPPRGFMDRLEMGASQEVAEQEQPPVSWSEAWRAAASITTLRRFWYSAPFLFVAETATLFLLTYYYASEFALGSRVRGFIGAGYGAAALIGLILSAPIADRLLAYRPGRVMTLIGGLLTLNAVTIAVLAYSRVLWISIVAALPIAFASALVTPALFTLLSLVVPSRIRGLGMQTIAPWRLIGSIILLLIGGVLDEVGIRESLIFFIPCFLVGAVILGTASAGVSRDIKAARAASMAEQAVRRAKDEGRSKLLVIRGLEVAYDGVPVLFDVDLDIDEGETVALLGTNGAGKSTLLRALSGVQEASNGAIFLDGRDITHIPPHENAAAGVVMMPGGQAVFPTLTVEENLKSAAWLFRKEEANERSAIEEALNLFPVLGERKNQTAGSLSGGEQQMLALAQAFIMRPRLLAIDELSLGLAPPVVEELLNAIRRMQEQGITIILVEQSINIALTIAPRAIFMERGQIRFDGPTTDLLARPELVRAVFMGTPAGRPVSGARPRSEEDRGVLLAADEIDVSYGGLKAVDSASIQVRSGEVVGIIGPNGAGKTTLFDVISGFLLPDQGRIFFEGQDVTGLSTDALARLGIMRSFQNVMLFPSLTVRETIAAARDRHIKPKSAALAAAWLPLVRNSEARTSRRAESLISLLRLSAFADKDVGDLSTGVRRLVDIACVMAGEPRLLLLDEPSSGLAQTEVEELGPVLLRLVKDIGCGLLIIEHDLPFVTSIADHLVAMNLGRVIASGPPAEVIENESVVSSYMAASGEVLGRSGSSASVLLKALERSKVLATTNQNDK